MKISVKAKTGAKENKVIPPKTSQGDVRPTNSSWNWFSPPLKLIPEDEEWYTVSVKERPVEGRANEAIIKLLAEYFKVSRSQIKLVIGGTSKKKIFKINL